VSGNGEQFLTLICTSNARRDTLKSVLIAAAVAVATIPIASVASQAQSASVTIRTDDGHYRYNHRDHDNGLHRGRYIGKHKGWGRHEARNEDCRTKTVKTYRHHKVVIQKTRVCD
jgi:hypothetical protein